MVRRALNPMRPLGWAVVTLVGVAIVAIVLGMGLLDRLGSGADVIDNAKPAFTNERVTGARAGIDAISIAVDTADPIVTDKGGAAAEVPKLVAFVSQQTGLSEGDVLAALQQNFPHTTALLQAAPLSSVSAELPKLVTLLSTVLKITPEQVGAALQQNFPRLAQAVGALPAVTAGWDATPGIDGLTRFDGTPVADVKGIRDYFGADVIPTVERNRENFQQLDDWVPVRVIAPLLLVVGIVVIVWGAWFLVRSLLGRLRLGESMFGWLIVPVVGMAVCLLVGLWNLFPALEGGQAMVQDLRPVFADARIQADTPAISMVSTVVDLLDPITTEAGGAAAEVPKLVAFVSQQTGLAEGDVVATLQKEVPHTAALLAALPLSSVSAELPQLTGFLSDTLKLSPEELTAALQGSFPRLAQSIANLPLLTAAWDALPNADGFTRFDGTPITNVTGARDYFGADVIPMLAASQRDYYALDEPPSLNLFPPLLLIIGGIVIVFGAFMLLSHDVSQRTARMVREQLRLGS